MGFDMPLRVNMLTATILLLPICASAAFAQNDGPTKENAVAQFNPDDFVTLDVCAASQFADLPVETASGSRIGSVRAVNLASDGSASRVLVQLNSGGSVWIGAAALRYNRYAQILLTNLKHIKQSADTAP